MHRRSHPAFTLIEMLTVIAVIAILTSLIVAVSGLVQRNAATKRAEGEIATMAAACENYKNDNGEVPRSKKTDLLDPRVDGNPVTGDTKEKYQDACLELYSALSGDYLPDKHPDFKPEEGKKTYYEFKPNNLNYKKTPEQKIQEVNNIQDPWGNCYGYSTARAKTELEFQKSIRADPNATRPTNMPGYNPTFDMWSTGGATRNRPKDGEQEDVKKWVKNW
jgi:prepilin-type N-terminal cleavage/methylation domain-containing protein